MCGKKRGLVGMVREKMREENCAGKDTAVLREQKFLCELAFLCDISSHLDALNLQLQGRGRIITDMYAAGAQGGSQRSRASSSLEVEGDQARGPIVTVGRASIGDSCFIVVNVDVRLQAAEVRNTETGASHASSGPLAQETPGPKGSPNRTPTENPPAPSQLPGPQPGGDGVRLALKAIWTKNSGHLTASQQEQLWELLREFKDSFDLGEESTQ
ncbi:hypothetical protein NHX12_014976 [Muraenolepis orangiensis]|uniref:Uncharacterized protein n=1 Tax=Muraenolepis orangiensis TaxID=630683 RepID=A0A9Q0D9U8_9TELE|nr:hypothetical protein NHX12_014976 [Muraenolepis orangiensis]